MAAAAAADGKSDYELQRELNIRKNEEKLRELGMEGSIGARVSPRTPAKKKAPARAFANAKDRRPAGRPKTRRQLKAARAAGEVVDEELGMVESEEEEQSEDEAEVDIDTAKVVADLKEAGKIGGAVASKEAVEGSREAFKKTYMRIKGGHYKEWAVDGTIKEGPRADYAAKSFSKGHFGQLNKEARLKPGHLPHMPVGCKWYARAEMEIVGFHAKQMNGIDYCSAASSKYVVDGTPLSYALTIISAGGYEDDVESPDGEWLWYTGEGKNDLNSSRRQTGSQAMKGGNEALLNSHKLNLPVRLARFIGKDVAESYTGRMYIYDGLYDVKSVKVDKGTQGFNVIKFLLVRQKNKENGKLRPNAVPPRHDRILQLGARDGSDEKYEAKAKRERQDAQEILSGNQQAKSGAAAAAAEPAAAEGGGAKSKRSRRG